MATKIAEKITQFKRGFKIGSELAKIVMCQFNVYKSRILFLRSHRYGDMRHVMSVEIVNMWNSLGTTKCKGLDYICGWFANSGGHRW